MARQKPAWDLKVKMWLFYRGFVILSGLVPLLSAVEFRGPSKSSTAQISATRQECNDAQQAYRTAKADTVKLFPDFKAFYKHGEFARTDSAARKAVAKLKGDLETSPELGKEVAKFSQRVRQLPKEGQEERGERTRLSTRIARVEMGLQIQKKTWEAPCIGNTATKQFASQLKTAIQTRVRYQNRCKCETSVLFGGPTASEKSKPHGRSDAGHVSAKRLWQGWLPITLDLLDVATDTGRDCADFRRTTKDVANLLGMMGRSLEQHSSTAAGVGSAKGGADEDAMVGEMAGLRVAADDDEDNSSSPEADTVGAEDQSMQESFRQELAQLSSMLDDARKDLAMGTDSAAAASLAVGLKSMRQDFVATQDAAAGSEETNTAETTTMGTRRDLRRKWQRAVANWLEEYDKFVMEEIEQALNEQAIRESHDEVVRSLAGFLREFQRGGPDATRGEGTAAASSAGQGASGQGEGTSRGRGRGRPGQGASGHDTRRKNFGIFRFTGKAARTSVAEQLADQVIAAYGTGASSPQPPSKRDGEVVERPFAIYVLRADPEREPNKVRLGMTQLTSFPQVDALFADNVLKNKLPALLQVRGRRAAERLRAIDITKMSATARREFEEVCDASTLPMIWIRDFLLDRQFRRFSKAAREELLEDLGKDDTATYAVFRRAVAKAVYGNGALAGDPDSLTGKETAGAQEARTFAEYLWDAAWSRMVNREQEIGEDKASLHLPAAHEERDSFLRFARERFRKHVSEGTQAERSEGLRDKLHDGGSRGSDLSGMALSLAPKASRWLFAEQFGVLGLADWTSSQLVSMGEADPLISTEEHEVTWVQQFKQWASTSDEEELLPREGEKEEEAWVSSAALEAHKEKDPLGVTYFPTFHPPAAGRIGSKRLSYNGRDVTDDPAFSALSWHYGPKNLLLISNQQAWDKWMGQVKDKGSRQGRCLLDMWNDLRNRRAAHKRDHPDEIFDEAGAEKELRFSKEQLSFLERWEKLELLKLNSAKLLGSASQNQKGGPEFLATKVAIGRGQRRRWLPVGGEPPRGVNYTRGASYAYVPPVRGPGGAGNEVANWFVNTWTAERKVARLRDRLNSMRKDGAGTRMRRGRGRRSDREGEHSLAAYLEVHELYANAAVLNGQAEGGVGLVARDMWAVEGHIFGLVIVMEEVLWHMDPASS
eukprot:g11738.t1